MKKFYSLISSFVAITIASSVYADSTSEITLPLQFSQNMTSTSITIENIETPLLLDLGNASSNVTLSDRVLKHIKVKYTGKINRIIGIDDKNKMPMKEFIIPKINIGGLALYNITGERFEHLWGASVSSPVKHTILK